MVKNTHNDLFFVHKKNKKQKSIRAIMQVPVTLTAFINLKDAELIWQGDSLRKIILLHATISEPTHHLNQMIIRETRAFQVYVGKDLYPAVGS